ncbi:MAG TPA: cytochrome P450 [Burkholderiales bacterium]|nr:cytochrome P450 [Burkholderiales bacterium]
MDLSAAGVLTPPRVSPPEVPLGRLAFMATFIRNPLEAMPRAVYERDIVPYGGRVWVTAPSLVRTVLLDERERYRKLSSIRLLGPLLGRGILTSEGAEWKWQRQAAAPMFRQQDLLRLVPAFVQAAARLAGRWRARPGVHAIDRDMTRVTFEVISNTLLPSADENAALVFERSMAAFQRGAGWGIFFASTGLPAWLPRPGMLSSARAVAALRRATQTVLDEQRAAHGAREDLLHRLMLARDPETGRSMDDTRLVDNLLTFYLAGHETTARALAWTLYLLARSPQWASLLEEEIAAVTGGAPVDAAHIDRLVLVQQVLKESMRLYPPAPLLARQAIDDLELGGERIRRGMSVVMPVYAIHRHAKRWAQPDVFDPVRFSPRNEASIERYQYLPFGAGPRICIGMAFAMIEATAMLATLIQHARFAPVEGRDPHPVARVTLLPRGGVSLRVTPK